MRAENREKETGEIEKRKGLIYFYEINMNSIMYV